MTEYTCECGKTMRLIKYDHRRKKILELECFYCGKKKVSE